MGQFKNVGNPAAALAEECGEVVQIIAKYYRFDEDWDAIPSGKDKSRWQQLEEEMDDLLSQWDRLKIARAIQLKRKGIPGKM